MQNLNKYTLIKKKEILAIALHMNLSILKKLLWKLSRYSPDSTKTGCNIVWWVWLNSHFAPRTKKFTKKKSFPAPVCKCTQPNYSTVNRLATESSIPFYKQIEHTYPKTCQKYVSIFYRLHWELLEISSLIKSPDTYII